MNFVFILQHRFDKKNDYDLESSWCELSSIFLQVFDDKCPITKKKIFKNSWTTIKKNLISKRDRAHDTLISKLNSTKEVLFRHLCNLVTIEAQKSRKQHYDQKSTLPEIQHKIKIDKGIPRAKEEIIKRHYCGRI